MKHLILREDGHSHRFLKLASDGVYDEVEQIIIRIDDIIENPIELIVDQKNWSVSVNGIYLIYFGGEMKMNMFLEDMFFAMEDI